MKKIKIAISVVTALITLSALVPWLETCADAYETWSTDRNTTNCAACHGNFRTTGYVSQVDGSAWLINGSPTNLHDGHRTVMLSGDCAACHSSASRFPVSLSSSS